MIVPADGPGAEPWHRRQLVAVALVNAIGLFIVMTSWHRASGMGRTASQTDWVGVGVIGAVVVAVGNGLWLLAGRRSVAHRAGLAMEPLGVRLNLGRSTSTDAGSDRDFVPVATAAMRWYHRPDCPLLAGKEVQPAAVAAHRQAGRAACGVCAP